MTDPKRPFVKVWDAMWEDPEVQGWGPAAELALLRAIQWSHRNDTDGFVPTRTWVAIVADLQTIDADPVDTLTTAEQLVPMAGGHLILKYAGWQQLSQERAAKLSNARRRGGKARAATAHRVNGRFAGAGSSAGSSAGDRKRRSHQHEPSTSPASATSSDPAQPGKRPEARGESLPGLGSGSTVDSSKDRTDLHPATSKARSRDVAWEVFVEVCGVNPDDLTAARRRELNGMLRSLKDLIPEPESDTEHVAQGEEIRRRATNWPWDVVITPEGLTGRWAELSAPRQNAPRPSRDRPREAAERAMRRPG